jgi:hypothetical protein
MLYVFSFYVRIVGRIVATGAQHLCEIKSEFLYALDIVKNKAFPFFSNFRIS